MNDEERAKYFLGDKPVMRPFNVNSMTLKDFEEFNDSAMKDFGGNYATKIIHDHRYVLDQTRYDNLSGQVKELKHLLLRYLENSGNSKKEEDVEEERSPVGFGR